MNVHGTTLRLVSYTGNYFLYMKREGINYGPAFISLYLLTVRAIQPAAPFSSHIPSHHHEVETSVYPPTVSQGYSLLPSAVFISYLGQSNRKRN